MSVFPFQEGVHYVVDPETGCWEWQRGRVPKGYGQITFNGEHRTTIYAHRVAYEAAHGKVGDGLCICHHCDNPPCINPEHLFVGSYTDNFADQIAKGRKPRGEGSTSHKLSEAQVREILRRAAGGENHRLIAQDHLVSRSLVSMLSTGKRWTWLDREGAV